MTAPTKKTGSPAEEPVQLLPLTEHRLTTARDAVNGNVKTAEPSRKRTLGHPGAIIFWVRRWIASFGSILEGKR